MTIAGKVISRALVQALALLAALVATMTAVGAERLLRDPFERPAARRPVTPVATAGSPAAAADPAAPQLAAAAPPWVPALRAVMHDPVPGRSLVNISGAVLATGESVHGYRVVKINERSVVVAHDGARLTLSLDNQEASQ